jgi:formamidopyrimidine-DNA glycosylase
MPELPEVESLRRHLVKRGLLGQVITSARVLRPKAVLAPSAEGLEQGAAGRRIEGFERRGKYLILRLDRRISLIVHLRMTGRLDLTEASQAGAAEGRGLRAVFWLKSGRELRFYDWRALGKLWLVDDPEQVVGKLGPEPLGEGFTPEYVHRALDRGLAVKALLLDQRVFAGVGNIYADEALWCAGVRPTRPARELTEAEAVALQGCLVQVLEAAVGLLERHLDEGGEFEAENGRGGVEPGAPYGTRFNVPRRKGQPCRRCGTPIQSIRVGGRGTFFCPRCQG